jgi:diacylglycerol kinase family enzyme
MAEIHFIVNPKEAPVGDRWPYEQNRIESVFKDFRVHLVRGRSHAEALTISAADQRAKLVVCVGGDGTLNEVANALFRLGTRAPALSIHPEFQKGSFCKSLSWEPSFLFFLEKFLNGTASEFLADLGRVEFTGEYGQKIDRVFLNSFGFGFSSHLLHKLRKQNLGNFSRIDYLRNLVNSLPFYRLHQVRLEVDDEEVGPQACLLGMLQNSAFFRDGFRVSPESQINDGELEWIQVKKASWPKYLFSAIRFAKGRLSEMEFVTQQKVRKLKIDALYKNRQIRVDLDGDSRGFLPARIEVLPKKLRILK